MKLMASKKDFKTSKRSKVFSAPSIPSKYDYRDPNLFCGKEESGFGSSTKRFNDRKTLYPGPGQYHRTSSYVKNASKCGSVSARGCTAMISQDPRFSNLHQLNSEFLPGPGQYNPSFTSTKPTRPQINFSNHHSNMIKRKHHQITPGPGHYGRGTSCSSISNLGASSFKFRARKETDLLLQKEKSQVAVGSYEVSKSLQYIENLGKEPRKGKGFPDPIFSSTTSRLASSIPPDRTPGPGHYEREPILTYAMVRPNASFNVGLDRFGNSNSVRVHREENPGPGSYYPEPIYININNMQSGAVASFESTSQRFEPEYGTDTRPPGPGESLSLFLFLLHSFYLVHKGKPLLDVFPVLFMPSYRLL